MKTIILTLFALIAFSAPVFAAPEIGQPAPDFTAADTNGNAVKLSELKGKIVVLEWTNHECPFVKKHYESGNMQKLQKEAAGKGAVWLSIVSSAEGMQGHTTAAQANDIMKQAGAVPAARILDSSAEIGRLYEAKTTPHMFVIGTDGVLAYAGAIDSDPSPGQEGIAAATNYAMAAINALAEGKPVATPVTQPYGCSVKYGM